MLYGWTDAHCLAMPAQRFFAMIQKGKDIQARRHALLMHDLLDVGAIGQTTIEKFQEMKTFYFNRMLSEFEREDLDEERRGFEEQALQVPRAPTGLRDPLEMGQVLVGLFTTKRLSEYGQ